MPEAYKYIQWGKWTLVEIPKKLKTASSAIYFST